ncbi:NAD(+) diphosphatase [Crossiella sp. SN42]|uniref:NAD(+) diphosphatase n=1 Tax=Crossiella sp. SN42 TaxID=2944808 RepID=UPI00207C2691|nr:NAD(+) diphosphatase [Crossiella sp. SN42]MCO1578126.1 NAD(+) diphosphatase [Crossiella sp. SN42]
MTQEFQLDRLPALSRSTVDRDDLLRDDPARLAELWREAQLLVVDGRGRVELLEGGAALRYRAAVEHSPEPGDTAVLLGTQDGRSYWAVPAEDGLEHEDWQDLRMSGALLDDTDAGLFTTAVGLLTWHRHSGFCARCGSPTKPERAGWARRCTGCGREEYPRTDPAVICLVHDGADQVILARQPIWPPERYSVLAGFVETGESLEACVVREVAEEVGVKVREVRYLASQPWPFPRSLMVGFAALADAGATLTPADGEIEEAMWVHRDKVREAIANDGEIPGLRLPPETSIARRMLDSWAAMRG